MCPLLAGPAQGGPAEWQGLDPGQKETWHKVSGWPLKTLGFTLLSQNHRTKQGMFHAKGTEVLGNLPALCWPPSSPPPEPHTLLPRFAGRHSASDITRSSQQGWRHHPPQFSAYWTYPGPSTGHTHTFTPPFTSQAHNKPGTCTLSQNASVSVWDDQDWISPEAGMEGSNGFQRGSYGTTENSWDQTLPKHKKTEDGHAVAELWAG